METLVWIEETDTGYVAGYRLDAQSPPVTRHFRMSNSHLVLRC